MAAEPAWSRRRRDDPVIGLLIAAGIPTTVFIWAAYWPTCTGEILFRPRRSYSADDLHRTASPPSTATTASNVPQAGMTTGPPRTSAESLRRRDRPRPPANVNGAAREEAVPHPLGGSDPQTWGTGSSPNNGGRRIRSPWRATSAHTR